jgi:hypothetical protein
VNQQTGRSQFQETYPGADVTPEELEFLMAVERFQRKHNRRYPTWREILFVLRGLGYRKVPPDPNSSPPNP